MQSIVMLSVMQSVTYNPFILSVIVPSVMAPLFRPRCAKLVQVTFLVPRI